MTAISDAALAAALPVVAFAQSVRFGHARGASVSAGLDDGTHVRVSQRLNLVAVKLPGVALDGSQRVSLDSLRAAAADIDVFADSDLAEDPGAVMRALADLARVERADVTFRDPYGRDLAEATLTDGRVTAARRLTADRWSLL